MRVFAGTCPTARTTTRLWRLPEGLLVVVELDVLLVAQLDGEVESEVPVGTLHEREARPPAAEITLELDVLLAELARVKVVGRGPVQVPVRRGAEMHGHVHLFLPGPRLREKTRHRLPDHPRTLILGVQLDGREDGRVLDGPEPGTRERHVHGEPPAGGATERRGAGNAAVGRRNRTGARVRGRLARRAGRKSPIRHGP